jgi:hypothetical protein
MICEGAQARNVEKLRSVRCSSLDILVWSDVDCCRHPSQHEKWDNWLAHFSRSDTQILGGDPAAELLRSLPGQIVGRHLNIWTHTSKRQLATRNFQAVGIEVHPDTIECCRHKMPVGSRQSSACAQSVVVSHPEQQVAIAYPQVARVFLERVPNTREQSENRRLLTLKPAKQSPRRRRLKDRVAGLCGFIKTASANTKNAVVGP